MTAIPEQDRNQVAKLFVHTVIVESSNLYSSSFSSISSWHTIIFRFSYFEMTGLVYLTGQGSAGRSFQCSGDIQLIQRQPLSHRGRDSRYKESPLAGEPPLHLAEILRNYGARNISLRVENSYSVWRRGTGVENFVLELNLNYPSQTVEYIPGFWQTIKGGWIQYLSVLVVFIYLFNSIKTFLFSQQILPTIIETPWKQ